MEVAVSTRKQNSRILLDATAACVSNYTVSGKKMEPLLF